MGRSVVRVLVNREESETSSDTSSCETESSSYVDESYYFDYDDYYDPSHEPGGIPSDILVNTQETTQTNNTSSPQGSVTAPNGGCPSVDANGRPIVTPTKP